MTRGRRGPVAYGSILLALLAVGPIHAPYNDFVNFDDGLVTTIRSFARDFARRYSLQLLDRRNKCMATLALSRICSIANYSDCDLGAIT